MLTWLLGLAVSGMIQPSPGGQEELPRYRVELQRKLQPLVCSGREPSPRQIMAAGVSDASLRVARLDAAQSQRLTPDRMLKAGRRLARKHNHLGFVTGRCRDGSRWAVTTPAPAGIRRPGRNGLLTIDPTVLRRHCAKYRLDFAPSPGGTPRRLWSQTDDRRRNPLTDSSAMRVNTAFLGTGTVGLTCTPKVTGKDRAGPILWNLLAIGRGPGPLPGVSLLEEGQSLERWVNYLRQATGLKPLNFTHPLPGKLAGKLAATGKVAHHQGDLQKVRRSLRDKSGRFIGENRVKGRSPADMAWLLWHSPRHRALLLSDKATHLGLHQRRLSDQRLAVLVFARLAR